MSISPSDCSTNRTASSVRCVAGRVGAVRSAAAHHPRSRRSTAPFGQAPRTARVDGTDLVGASESRQRGGRTVLFSSLTRSDTHAVSLLKADHRQVERLFREFEDARDGASKVRIARDICTELTLHAEVEETLLYPNALRALDRDGDKLVREAAVEHRSLKQLIEAIDGTGPSNTLFEANVTVLKEYV